VSFENKKTKTTNKQ